MNTDINPRSGNAANRDLAAQVFSCFSSVVQERAADLRAFVTSGYSFENWALWETAARCWRRSDWTVHVEPMYRIHALAGISQDARGDLLIESAGERIFVELALMHDWTSTKWYSGDGKLAGDRARLMANQGKGIGLLQVVIIVGRCSDIRGNDSWNRAFATSGCWVTPPTFEGSHSLVPDGEGLVFGWWIQKIQDKKSRTGIEF